MGRLGNISSVDSEAGVVTRTALQTLDRRVMQLENTIPTFTQNGQVQNTSVSDGDKGDVLVSGSGSLWTVHSVTSGSFNVAFSVPTLTANRTLTFPDANCYPIADTNYGDVQVASSGQSWTVSGSSAPYFVVSGDDPTLSFRDTGASPTGGPYSGSIIFETNEVSGSGGSVKRGSARIRPYFPNDSDSAHMHVYVEGLLMLPKWDEQPVTGGGTDPINTPGFPAADVSTNITGTGGGLYCLAHVPTPEENWTGSDLYYIDATSGKFFRLNAKSSGGGTSFSAAATSMAYVTWGDQTTVLTGSKFLNWSASSYIYDNGTATTVVPELATDQAITWTGAHVFNNNETVHNGGIDVGTSGRFDSNVANGAGASSFLFQPTVAQTAGVDRYLWRLNSQAGTSALTVFANGLVEFNGLAGSNTGFIQVAGTIPTGPYYGINFAPASFTSTGTVGPFSTAVSGALFQVIAAASQNSIAGHFLSATSFNSPSSSASVFAGLFESRRAGTGTITDIGCIYLYDSSTSTKGTTTTWRGIYGASLGSLPAAANRYWIDLTEITSGSAAKNSILLQQSNSGYKALAFRNQNSWINSNDDGHLDLNASTSIDMNADVDMSTVDIITDTSTGTKIGTGATQLLGFWNATPVAQSTGWAVTNEVDTKSFDADTVTHDQLADVVGTIVETLKTYGILGA